MITIKASAKYFARKKSLKRKQIEQLKEKASSSVPSILFFLRSGRTSSFKFSGAFHSSSRVFLGSASPSENRMLHNFVSEAIILQFHLEFVMMEASSPLNNSITCSEGNEIRYFVLNTRGEVKLHQANNSYGYRIRDKKLRQSRLSLLEQNKYFFYG